MKVKELVEKLHELDQDGDLVLFTKDLKRPHLGTGTLTQIKDICFFVSIDQDTNKGVYGLKIIKKDE